MPTLEPLEPETALELYLQDKQPEQSQATQYSHKSRLGHFLRWCDEQEIENLNSLSGRDLQRYKLWRRDDGDLNTVTLKTQMDTLRVFIRWCETVDAVTPDLSTKVQSPTLADGDNQRETMLESDTAAAVLAHLEKYEYASVKHVTLAILWQTMMRRGAVRALDCKDYDRDDQVLRVRHRPETGTPIKNQHQGERTVAIDDDLCHLLNDWVSDQRPSVTDDHGRQPLLATTQGRPHAQTIQKYVYASTRPCIYTGTCPIGRDQDSCEALATANTASKCPESVSPHAIRRGSITHWLQRDVPMRAVSDRANVSQDVLSTHYDQRSEHEKAEQRRRYLEQI